MPLEAAVVVLDNSEYSRNGDLNQSRWASEQEAIELYINIVIDQNAESGMGLILGGGKQVRLLMTPTNDRDQIMGQLHKTRLEGNLKFAVALQQASLALKHRINKQQQQRIVAFVASPIDEDPDTLINLAKKLKKNNIAVDLINFGEQNEDHLERLKLFFDNVQKGNSSRFINITPGKSATEVLFTCLSGQQDFQAEVPQQPGQPQQQGGRFLEFGGIDPNLDPELAMAMKLSMEEDEQRKQQTQPPQQQPPQQPQAIQEEKVEVGGIEEEDLDEQALLEQAKLLSLQEEQNNQEQQQQQQQQPQQQPPKPAASTTLTQGQAFQDPQFLNELLESLQEEGEEDKLLKKEDENKKD